jgi:ABC-type transport system involved in multi-copper enzyme maturation permease subunit
MTALTVSARPGQDAGPRALPWRRMLWVTWRQQRATLISVPVVLGAVAVFLLLFGLKVHRDYASVVNCSLDPGARSQACSAAFSYFNSTDWPLGNACAILLQFAPVLLGAFAGAPVLARELETGTFRYAWTQGCARERQVIAKLVLLGGTLAIVAGAFSAVFTWFFQPFLYPEQLNVLSGTVFSTHWPAFAAYTLAAFAIGAFLGMLFRRIIPAMAATLGVYLAVRLAAWGLRKYYPVAVVTSDPRLFNGFPSPSSPGFPWILSTWFTGPGGRPASESVVNQYLNHQYRSTPNAGASLPAGYTEWTRYIPFSHFWPMQFIEAGWLLVLAVAFGAATVWLVRHRAA